MSNEIRIYGSLSWARDGMAQTLSSLGVQVVNQSGQAMIRHRQLVGTVEEPLILGDVVVARGWCFIRNTDPANYVTIKPAAGGTVTAQVDGGEFAMFRFGVGVTAPYVQANTSPLIIEYLLLQG